MGLTLKDVQEWLGHSDIKMTANIYSHLDVNRKKTMADKLALMGHTSDKMLRHYRDVCFDDLRKITDNL